MYLQRYVDGGRDLDTQHLIVDASFITGEYLPENEFKLGDVKSLLSNIRAKMADA